jgi:hypothetical protein
VLPRSAAEQRLSDSCRHEASGGKLLAVWSTQSVCVEHTERVQLQPHAKLVAIQTEACPAVRSTQAWSTQSVCVEHTERVQLQPHAKLVAIQTEACPAVRSPTTQPRPRPPLDPTTQLPAPSLRLGWSLR